MPRRPLRCIVDGLAVQQSECYAWDKDIALTLYGAKDQNVKLCQVLDQTNFKAKAGIGIATTEWIIWSFEKQVKLADACDRVEAAWAGTIHPAYTKDLKFKLTRSSVFHENPAIDGPLKLALNFLGNIDAHFATGNIYLAAAIVQQIMLARHVISDKQNFDGWLSDAIRRSSEVFHRGVEYDTRTKKHDASHEIPVPREFYESGFVYTPEVGKQVLQEFLKTLDYTKNPYLRSPEEMREKGFLGTPYVL